MAEIDIVRELQVKDNEGVFGSPIPIGVNQYLVSSLRGSNTNNLEEQYILGADYVSTQWTEAGVGDQIIYITEKEFYNIAEGEPKPSAYYKLVTKDYEIERSSYSYLTKIDGKQTLVIENSSFTSSSIENETPNIKELVQEQFLYYVKGVNSTLVASKKKYKELIDDGNTKRRVIKEEIVNHLSE